MASGTPVVRTYAKGIENLIEPDIIWMTYGLKKADKAIYTLMNDDVEWQNRVLREYVRSLKKYLCPGAKNSQKAQFTDRAKVCII